MENLRKNRDIKLVTTKRKNCFVSEPNNHTTKFSTENLLAIKKTTEKVMNKPVYLGLSILELSKTFKYEFYINKIFGKVKLCYIDTDGFIVYIKHMIFIKILHKMLETRFDN